MATKIVTKNSSTASAVPTASDLVQGELAVNVADKRLFTEDNAGAIVELGTNPSTIDINAGTIDGTAIGASSASTGAFTTLTASGAFTSLGIDDNADATAITIDSSENVGIGTSSPSTKLHLGGTAPLDSIIRQDSTVSGTNWEIGEREAGKWQIFEDDSDSVVATFTSSGNVGIGNSSPPEMLTIGSTSDTNVRALFLSSTTGAGTIQFGDGTGASAYSGYINYTHSDNALAFATGSAERARLDSSGNLLVGRSSDSGLGKLQVYGGADIAGGDVYLARDTGNVLVGTTDVSASAGEGIKLRASSNAKTLSTVSSRSTSADEGITMWSTGANTWRFYVGWGGKINATSNTIQAISDQRFKENIRDLDDGLSKVMELRPRKFDWKEGKGADIKDDRGFIAQEFEEVFPDLVGEWKDEAPEGEEPYKAVSQDLIPTLVKAIQEQQTLIESLTTRIAALEE